MVALLLFGELTFFGPRLLTFLFATALICSQKLGRKHPQIWILDFGSPQHSKGVLSIWYGWRGSRVAGLVSRPLETGRRKRI
jgi:hypothetical protein